MLYPPIAMIAIKHGYGRRSHPQWSEFGRNRSQQAGPEGSRTMKYMQAVLAVVGIFVISGAIAPAQADDDKRSVTLYTSALRATGFNCNAVNVSRKTLTITISIIDLDGIPLAVSPPTPTARDTEASTDVDTSPTPTDAYCKFEVVGTGDRNDLRVVLATVLIRTFNQGGQTNIPVFVAKTIEGH
jgi:hypothetical protein